MLARFKWYLDPLSPKKYIVSVAELDPSGSAPEKNQYIDNSMQTRQAHFSSVSKCVDQTCRKMCIKKCALNVLLNAFFASKAPNYEGSNLCTD